MEVILTKEELANEVWLDFEWKDMNYKISNMGRVMSYFGSVQHLMKLQKNQYGEMSVMLTGRDRESAHNMLVGKEVAKRFVPNPNGYRHIRFKDGNKLNCRASNLEWVKHTDKMAAQYKSFLKKINQYDAAGKYLRSFESSSAAAEALGVSPNSITRICTEPIKNVNGFLYRYDTEYPAGQDVAPPAKETVPVYQFEKNGTFVQKFESIKEAGLYLGKPHAAGNISRCAKGERPSACGYVWRFSEDF